MEKVDIIMAVYNCEKYIKEAIISVKKQSYTNWNLIIIDDKSTDKTLDIIKDTIIEVKQKVKIIKLKEHKGVAKARNIGIEESKSQYIAFLDADDIWDKEKLKKQIQFMKTNSYNFTYTRFCYKKEKREKIVGIFPKSLNYKQALKNTFILTSTVMINTKEINKELIKMPDVKSEDTATWWQILKDNNISRNSLARNGELRYDTILSYYRNEVTRLDTDTLAKLCSTLNCRIEDIIEYKKK